MRVRPSVGPGGGSGYRLPVDTIGSVAVVQSEVSSAGGASLFSLRMFFYFQVYCWCFREVVVVVLGAFSL